MGEIAQAFRERLDRKLALRLALYGAVGGGIGATVGWLLWLTAIVLNWEMFLVALLGAVLAFIVEWLRGYYSVANPEAGSEDDGEAERGRRQERVSSSNRPWYLLAGIFGFVIPLGWLTLEHLASHVVALAFLPCLASIAGFAFPGAMVALAIWPGTTKGPLVSILNGAATLPLAGLLFLSMWLIFAAMVPLRQNRYLLYLLSWWFLYTSLFCFVSSIVWLLRSIPRWIRKLFGGPGAETATFHPSSLLLAPALIPVLIAYVGSPRNQAFVERLDQDPGPFNLGPDLTLRAVNSAVRAPDLLPPSLWLKAEDQLPAAANAEGSRWPPILQGAGSWLARQVGCDNPNPKLPGSPFFLDIRGRPKSEAPKQNSAWVCAQFRLGIASPMVRSCFVLFGFGAGTTLACFWERRLRPIVYPSSHTKRMDRRAAVVVGLFLLFTIVVVRLRSG
jgi:hypothetical protein